MNQANIRNLNWYIPALFLILTACESMGAEGNLGVGVVAGIAVAILLGWGAFRLLGGMLRVGIWSTVILVIIVIGVVIWLVFKFLA